MKLTKYKLGDVARIVNGSTPSTTCPDYYDGDIVWITPKDLSDQKTKYIEKGSRNITEKGYSSCSTQIIPPYNILLTSRAPIGLIAINKVECCTNQGFKNIVVNKTIVDVDYLFYYLKFHIKEIEALGTGTTFKEVSKTPLEKFELSIPDLDTQRRIASVLSNLDRKIALNRQINANLEALAKQLYDYWFVQFDFPDANGKPYKSSGGKMVYNEKLKREIPEGWNVCKLGKSCEVLLGGTPDTTDDELWDGSYPWLNSGEVAEFPIVSSEKTITEKGLKSSATAFAPNGSVTLSITRHLRASILAINACINQSVVAITETEKLRKEYIYPLIWREIPRYMVLRTGAQQPHINKETVEGTWIIIPHDNILSQYYNKVDAIYQRIIINAEENLSLTRQRDELLPLLMNGQVKVE